MNYLVTGATGFIGRKLVGQLLAPPVTAFITLSCRRNDDGFRAPFFHWSGN